MHITSRGGVFQYQRRVPQQVVNLRSEFDLLFGGRPLFRRSLATRDHTEALARAAEVEQEFESKVSRALNKTQR